MLLWCLKSSPLERWRKEEAEASRSKRGEECIRPLAAAHWRPERPQPQQEEEEEEEEEKEELEEEEEEQLVMTSVWGLKTHTYVTQVTNLQKVFSSSANTNPNSANTKPFQNPSW